MGNRSRYRPPTRSGDYRRGHREGVQAGMDDSIHLILADLPGSAVTVNPDGTFDCSEDAGCHGCELERHGFHRLARQWRNAEPCEQHQ